VNTYGSPKQVVINLEDIVYPGGYMGKHVSSCSHEYFGHVPKGLCLFIVSSAPQ
jgi:hypothetical protein